MIFKKTYLTGLLLAAFVFAGQAQDFHLSQPFASPSTLNPALTGVMEGNIRLMANYRTQWFNVASYTTYGVAADGNIARQKINDNILGVGGSVFHDLEERSGLSNIQATFSLAYNLKVARSPVQYIGLGLNAGLLRKQLDLSNAIFGSQFESGDNTDPILNENLPGARLDVGIGFSWFLATSKHSASVGGALFHVNQPDFGVFAEDKLYRKWTAYASAEVGISRKMALNPTILFLLQGPSHEIITGLFAKTIMDNRYNDMALYFGAMYRIVGGDDKTFASDAFIPALRFQVEGLLVGFSYDFTMSALSGVSKTNGGPELSLSVELPFRSKQKGGFIQCPKF